MSVVDDLKAARAEVEKGWCKRTFGDSEGNVCTRGAVNTAVSGDPFALYAAVVEPATMDDWWERQAAACEQLRKHIPPAAVTGLEPIAEFNDAPTTTKQDVLNLFDKALADLGGLA